jgi:hypothetical protein
MSTAFEFLLAMLQEKALNAVGNKNKRRKTMTKQSQTSTHITMRKELHHG